MQVLLMKPSDLYKQFPPATSRSWPFDYDHANGEFRNAKFEVTSSLAGKEREDEIVVVISWPLIQETIGNATTSYWDAINMMHMCFPFTRFLASFNIVGLCGEQKTGTVWSNAVIAFWGTFVMFFFFSQ